MFRDLDWNLLKNFAECSRFKTFKEGASFLQITPQTLRGQMSDLEDFLQKTLFIRVHKNMSTQLTQEGNKLLEKVFLFNKVLEGEKSISVFIRLPQSLTVKLKT